MNIVEPILFQCKLNPLATAICVPGAKIESVTYKSLETFIHNVARTALKSGIAPGDIVALGLTDTVLHVACTLGLMHMGAATMSMRGSNIAEATKPDLVLTDAPTKVMTDSTVVAVDHSWLHGDGAAKPVPVNGADQEICRIILTSGSTGEPKGIAFSHQLLAARIAHYTYSKGPRFAHCSRLYCDLGFGTSPGFRYALALLSRGGTIFFLGPEPADILQAISLHKVQGMATSPYSLGEYLRFFEADPDFDVSFDHIICQGGMLSRQLSQRARTRLCQNLYCSYGSTETTTVAFGPASVLERQAGAVGFIQPGVLVEAIDESGKALPPLQDGLLRIRSDNMASGYFRDEELTARFFRDGFFYSGDIGHITPEGILVITGREKTALNVGGDTVSPERVESVIGEFPNIREAAVLLVNDDLGISRLVALIVAETAINEVALREYCAQRLSPSAVPVRIIRTDGLPRGGQGKIDRQRLSDLAAKSIKIADKSL